MQQELAEVVDRVGDEGRDGEVVGARLALFGREVRHFDAGEVEEGVTVVVCELSFCLGRSVSASSESKAIARKRYLVVISIHTVKLRVHSRLYRVKRIQDGLTPI